MIHNKDNIALFTEEKKNHIHSRRVGYNYQF
jgi:hypothetical protein